MYEKLTAFIPALQRENFGDYQTIVEEYSNGGGNFGETALRLQSELRNFVEEHPEFGLTQYNKILVENGLWGRAAERADVETLDGQLVVALLVAVWRIDRLTCWGTLFADYYESGYILKWLERLKAIDEA